jgi:hypothetical protein
MHRMLRSVCLAPILAAMSIGLIGCRGLDVSHHANADAAGPQSTGIPMDYLPALKGEYFQYRRELSASHAVAVW